LRIRGVTILGGVADSICEIKLSQGSVKMAYAKCGLSRVGAIMPKFTQIYLVNASIFMISLSPRFLCIYTYIYILPASNHRRQIDMSDDGAS